jgi:NitT/TauT family transport system substrate-binding protein
MARILTGAAAWTALISVAHGALNVDWSSIINDRLPEEERKLNVAYLPVT